MGSLFSPEALERLRQQFVLYLPRIATAVVILLVFWAIVTVVTRLIRRLADPQKHNSQVVDFLAKIVKVVLWVFAAVTVLGTLGVDVGALIGGLGLTGFALGFALKDIISNLLSGVLLLIYQPFERHERIKVSGWEGIVVDIDLRYTTLDTTSGRVLIPNANLFTTPVELLDRNTASPQ